MRRKSCGSPSISQGHPKWAAHVRSRVYTLDAQYPALPAENHRDLNIDAALPGVRHTQVHRYRVLRAIAAATVNERRRQQLPRAWLKDTDFATSQRLPSTLVGDLDKEPAAAGGGDVTQQRMTAAIGIVVGQRQIDSAIAIEVHQLHAVGGIVRQNHVGKRLDKAPGGTGRAAVHEQRIAIERLSGNEVADIEIGPAIVIEITPR